MSVTLLFFIMAIIINFIITIVLISRHTLSSKILKEIKPGVQSVINDIDTRIALLMDMMEEAETTKMSSSKKTVQKTAQKTDNKPKQKTGKKTSQKTAVHTETTDEQQNEHLHNDEVDIKKRINTLLMNGNSIETVMETLDVSYEEVYIMQNKI